MDTLFSAICSYSNVVALHEPKCCYSLSVNECDLIIVCCKIIQEKKKDMGIWLLKCTNFKRDLKFDMDNVICTTCLLFPFRPRSHDVLKCAVKVEDNVVISANKIFLLFLVHGFPI